VNSPLNSVEVFDISIQKWRMVSSMAIARYNLGVGILNNRLYAVTNYIIYLFLIYNTLN